MIDLGEPPPVPPSALVVDDEETIRHLLGQIVARVGGRADLAENGARAKAMLEEKDYTCAILDKNLPDVTGIQLLAHIKERHPRCEVLIVTGYANMESAIEALRLGAFDYIVKPFDVAGVAHRVRMAMERRRLLEDLERTNAALRTANAKLDERGQDVRRAYLESVMRLSLAAELRDDGAAGHLRRISRYCGILARAVDAREAWVEDIVCASPLHDVGKIAVPDAVLRKPGPLTPSERAAVREHVAVGAKILEGTTSDILALAREIVLTHHERWDGQGYPRGLRADEIPLSGRIMALADAWDAVSTDRVYRKALPPEAALAEIRNSAGTCFDESLVAAFFDHLPQVQAVAQDTPA